MPLSNLPPGVTEGMIPGNRPIDAAWDAVYDWIGSVDISPYELQNLVLDWAEKNGRDYEVPAPLDKEVY